VRAELCRGRPSTGRAVVVLHGCGGFSTFDHRLAVELPQHGISTLDVDYFEPPPPPGRKGFCNARGGVNAFATWLRVVDDAAASLSRTPGVELYHALRADGVPNQLYVYPHGSHQWPGPQGTLGIAHAAAFLRRYLP
jgi:hypothetical protein